MMQWGYGAGQSFSDSYIDVTASVRRYCTDGTRFYIPPDDFLRAEILGDPLPGTVKELVLVHDGDLDTARRFDADTAIVFPPPEEWKYDPPPRRTVRPPPPHLTEAADKVAHIHRQLRFAGGSMLDEMPEQSMAVAYIRPDARVLELGANIGRNTLVIAALLDDDTNLVALECDPVAVELLRNNRYLNGMGFHIEPSALSYRRLMQKGWATVPGEELREDYRWVHTITTEEVRAKYPIDFDTLVADCEGSLYFILSDNDTLLTGITTVIVESDYLSAQHKRTVEKIFTRHGLRKVYSEPLVPTWRHPFPPECVASFFEVWQRDA